MFFVFGGKGRRGTGLGNDPNPFRVSHLNVRSCGYGVPTWNAWLDFEKSPFLCPFVL